MANTYTTVINQMYTITNPDGFVVNVNFTVSGTDGTNTANIGGSCQYTFTDGQVVIPYNQLTEEIVIGWINESTNKQENYYAYVDGQINLVNNAPAFPSLPWSA